MRSLVGSREKDRPGLTLRQSIDIERLDLKVAASGELWQLFAVFPGLRILPLLVGGHQGIETNPGVLQQQVSQFRTGISAGANDRDIHHFCHPNLAASIPWRMPSQ